MKNELSEIKTIRFEPAQIEWINYQALNSEIRRNGVNFSGVLKRLLESLGMPPDSTRSRIEAKPEPKDAMQQNPANVL